MIMAFDDDDVCVAHYICFSNALQFAVDCPSSHPVVTCQSSGLNAVWIVGMSRFLVYMLFLTIHATSPLHYHGSLRVHCIF
jgi:hypothetical protein